MSSQHLFLFIERVKSWLNVWRCGMCSIFNSFSFKYEYLISFIYFTLCIWFLCLHVCMHVCGAPRDQSKASYSLNWSWRLWAAVWLLRTEPRSSLKITSALNHGTISPALIFVFHNLKCTVSIHVFSLNSSLPLPTCLLSTSCLPFSFLNWVSLVVVAYMYVDGVILWKTGNPSDYLLGKENPKPQTPQTNSPLSSNDALPISPEKGWAWRSYTPSMLRFCLVWFCIVYECSRHTMSRRQQFMEEPPSSWAWGEDGGHIDVTFKVEFSVIILHILTGYASLH